MKSTKPVVKTTGWIPSAVAIAVVCSIWMYQIAMAIK